MNIQIITKIALIAVGAMLFTTSPTLANVENHANGLHAGSTGIHVHHKARTAAIKIRAAPPQQSVVPSVDMVKMLTAVCQTQYCDLEPCNAITYSAPSNSCLCDQNTLTKYSGVNKATGKVGCYNKADYDRLTRGGNWVQAI